MVSFDPTSYTVTEGEDDFVQLMLVRSGDLSRATVVTVTTEDDSATGITKSTNLSHSHILPSPAGSDYMSTTVEVTFAAGSTRATVDVSIVDDTEIENSEMFTAVLSSSQSNAVIVDGTATVTILDNDGEKLFSKFAINI